MVVHTYSEREKTTPRYSIYHIKEIVILFLLFLFVCFLFVFFVVVGFCRFTILATAMKHTCASVLSSNDSVCLYVP